MFKRKRIPTYLMIEDNPVYMRRKIRRWPVVLTTFVATSVLFLMLAAQGAFAIEEGEPAAGSLLMEHEGEVSPSVMLASSVDFAVNGLIAHVSVKQTFKNDSKHWQQAKYVVPLPDKAAVKSMVMTIGERVIVGKVHEKHEAKKIYAAAKKAGKKAALTQQQRPNLFSQRVANIAPGEEITVALEYVEPVLYRDGVFSLRFPMTLTPRYMPEQKLVRLMDADLAIDVSIDGWGQFDEPDIGHSRDTTDLLPSFIRTNDLANPISISATVDMGMVLKTIDSLFHPIALSREENKYRLQLANGAVPMDRDFVLQWQPDVGREPKAAVFAEQVNGEQYAMVMVLPPQQNVGVEVLPKEVIYIIDTSGSMGGQSIIQARKSLQYGLEQLKPSDRFNIIEFNSNARQFYSQPLMATASNVELAKAQVAGLQATGGTQMMKALNLAFADTNNARQEEYLRQIIFITDGSVGNEDQLFKEIHQQLGSDRLFTVGIGSAPNSWFMRKAAEFGRGTFTHIGAVSDVYKKMALLFSKLDSPVAKNISIKWPQGVMAETYPEKIPDLYQGEPLMVVAKLGQANGVNEQNDNTKVSTAQTKIINVSGKLAKQNWSWGLKMNGNMQGQHKGVGTLWAREKIAALMDEMITGAAEQQVRPKVLAVALQHQLLSKYTSFVAVEEKVSRPMASPLKLSEVKNLMPHGSTQKISTHKTFAIPKTATPAALNMLLGLLALLIAAVLWFWPSSWNSNRGCHDAV